MSDEIQKIQRYIELTPGLSGKMSVRFSASFNDAMALADMVEESPIKAIITAIEYGRALGLRMGRREVIG